MKVRNLLACAMAALALAACNKNKSEGASRRHQRDRHDHAGQRRRQAATGPMSSTRRRGGFMMGNPNAKVKLVEIGSLTCPHCREFDEKGVPTLVDKYVKIGPGQLGIPHLRAARPFDIPATLIARCNGAKSFFPLAARALQGSAELDRRRSRRSRRTSSSRCRTCRPNQQFVAMAKLAGLPGLGGGARRSAGQEQPMPERPEDDRPAGPDDRAT